MLRANLIALVALVVAGGALALWQPWRSSDDADSPADFPPDAARLLDRQLRAMTASTDPEQFIEAAGGGRAAQRAASALHVLGATAVDLRYVDGGQAPTREDGTTTVTARITWRSDGSVLPSGERRSTAALRFRFDGEQFVFAAAEPHQQAPLPLWLAGPVEVADQGEAVLLRVGTGDLPPATSRQAAHAAATVRSTVQGLPADPLVVVAPESVQVLAALVGGAVEETAQVAAVTTRLDAAAESGAVVLLNPEVFAQMDSRAQQIVMTHEAVHQLTRVVGSPQDDTMWVVEGFADWVALRDDDAGLQVSAGRILEQVRAQGPPDHLPTRQDFAGGGVTAVYESAWLAMRMLVEQHGFEAVSIFYAAVIGQESPHADEALRAALDTDLASVTAKWRDYLTYNASTVS